MSLLKVFSALLLAACVCAAPGSVWAKAKEKEPKVSELLKDANEVMSQASAFYVDGKSKEAIEAYRKALAEIDSVEQGNPQRVASSEFAPVRFRRALCETEIDRIMLEDMNATARTVAVTDTAALEAKRAARKQAAETNNVPDAAVKLTAKQNSGAPESGADATAAQPETDDPAAPVNVREELEWAKDMLSVDRFGDVEKALVKVLKSAPDNVDARLMMALSRVQQGRHSDALVVLDDLRQDAPNDEAVLLLAAGAYVVAGQYSRALDALDALLKVNPQRPDGYHNMAWLLLEMNPGKLDDPEMYYRQAVKLGGPRDRDLERRLGIKPE
jgi:tetratricopeptide (TPR) repeat protein